MSARGFRSVFMVGGIAGAALGCYLVSLRVATERAALENVENRIVLAQRDIRLLDTEIGTRGRLAQLERWNVKVIRLSAPTADQFVDGAFQLATLAKPDKTPAIEVPIVLASAPLPPRRESVASDAGGDSAASLPASRPSRPLGEMMHVASYKTPEPRLQPLSVEPARAKAVTAAVASIGTKPKPAATKPIKTAMADPLSPLFGGSTKAKSSADGAARAAAHHPKDPGSH